MAHRCWYCGTTEQNKWCEETKKSLEAQKLCFQCNFWLEYAWIQGREDQVITPNFWHYVIGKEQPATYNKSCLGYGGAKFFVCFYPTFYTIHPKRKVITTNLWCQGEIPPAFQHLFTPNATVEGVN